MLSEKLDRFPGDDVVIQKRQQNGDNGQPKAQAPAILRFWRRRRMACSRTPMRTDENHPSVHHGSVSKALSSRFFIFRNLFQDTYSHRPPQSIEARFDRLERQPCFGAQFFHRAAVDVLGFQQTTL
jgi:hypothetical protein